MRSAFRASRSHRANSPPPSLSFFACACAYREQKEKQEAKERYWKVDAFSLRLSLFVRSVLRILR